MVAAGGGGRGLAPSTTRRPNLRTTMKAMRGFRFSQQIGSRRTDNTVPEERVGDLHEHFRTCTSLTRIREELRNALHDDEEKKLGFGLNVCARPEADTGRLLLHSIGLNKELILSAGGVSAAQSRIDHFVLHELLLVRNNGMCIIHPPILYPYSKCHYPSTLREKAYPPAIVEADDKGCIPFVEPIM